MGDLGAAKMLTELRVEDLEVPSLSTVVVEVIRLAAEPNPNARALASTLKRDPNLSAQVLQLANSALYGQWSSVTTVDRALALIGLNAMKSIVLGVSVVNAVDDAGGDSIDLRSFWRDSLLRACVARELAREVRPKLMEEAYLVGLLQDLGIPMLLSASEAYRAVYKEAGGCRVKLHALESAGGGLTHSRVIAHLCVQWLFPELLTAALSGHHDAPPAGSTQDPALVLSQISYVVGALPLGAEGVQSLSDARLLAFLETSLGCPPGQFDVVLERAAQAFEALRAPFAGLLEPECDAAAAIGVVRGLIQLAQEGSKWFSGLRIVVVESSRVQQTIIDRMLRAMGSPGAHILDTGEAFLARYGELRPDVVVCSYHLSDMSAPELETALRTTEDADNVCFLVVSSDDKTDDSAFRDRRRVALLRKPFKPDALQQSFDGLRQIHLTRTQDST